MYARRVYDYTIVHTYMYAHYNARRAFERVVLKRVGCDQTASECVYSV